MSLNGKQLLLPITPQLKSFTCGCAIIKSIIEWNDHNDYDEKDIAKIVKADPKFGTKQREIFKFFKKNGYQAFYKQNLKLQDLFDLLDQKQPVITCIQAWSEKKNVDYSTEVNSGHYVIVVGYDLNANIVVFMDPAIEHYYGVLTIEDFKQRWRGYPKDGLDQFGMVVIGRLDGETAKIDKQSLKKIK
jgi:predicted double-glycine peptidase